ncbi:flagellar attachment zone protein 1-like [Chaetodon trifascialis]|uniref:flagellar attachment zone protein 1-like n=1 Tax=Chaetodon trifascialis TaxID=109706 RepID=UPI00399338B0
MNQDLVRYRRAMSEWNEEREKLCHSVQHLQQDNSRLQELLELKEREFQDELKRTKEMSSLKTSVQSQTDQVEIIPDQSDETLHLTLEKLQRTLNQVVHDLYLRDEEIDLLKEEKDCLSLRLEETTATVSHSRAEFIRCEKAWKITHNNLQEKFRKKLAEKEQSWETREKELEGERKCLEELCRKASEGNEEREKLCHSVQHLQQDNNRLQELLELKEREFQDELKRTKEMSSLIEQVEIIPAQSIEILQLKLENQKSVVLQNDLQMALNKVTHQLYLRDEEVHLLEQEKDRLSLDLQEKFTEELAEKVQSWETREKELEGERKHLEELCLKANTKRRALVSRNKWVKAGLKKTATKKKTTVKKTNETRRGENANPEHSVGVNETTDKLPGVEAEILHSEQTEPNDLQENFREELTEVCQARANQTEEREKDVQDIRLKEESKKGRFGFLFKTPKTKEEKEEKLT